MAHRGELYSFSVRAFRKPFDPPRRFGDVDLKGTNLNEVLPEMLRQIHLRTRVPKHRTPQPLLRCAGLFETAEKHHHAAVLAHRRHGNRGRVIKPDEVEPVIIGPRDGLEFGIGIVISAPPNSELGHIALHNQDRRSVKWLVERELKRLFFKHFGLLFEMDLTVPFNAVRQALSEGVGAIAWHLTGVEAVSDLFGDDSWFKAPDPGGRIEVKMTPGRGKRLDGQMLVALVERSASQEEDAADLSELLPDGFSEGDELKVDVFINGQKKQVIVDASGASFARAFSIDLGLPHDVKARVVCRHLVEMLPS